MHSFAATLMLACCVAASPVVAQTGNPNNNVPYGPETGPPPSAQTPPTHATPVSPAAPAAAPIPAAYSGCVMISPTDKDTLLLNTESVCAVLTGKLSTDKLAGHEIDIKGVLTPRVSRIPASIHIDSIVHVGKSCSATCSPLPPRSRGLGGDTPGKEGGTPGLVPTRPPTP